MREITKQREDINNPTNVKVGSKQFFWFSSYCLVIPVSKGGNGRSIYARSVSTLL
jgi:hypothetical protein